MAQIILTAMLRGWFHDRDKMQSTLQERVKAKVVKNVLDQVDFLTSMMAVANTEHMESMVRYINDPVNNPKPKLRIESIKDYKDISDNLYKLVIGATQTGKGSSPMMDALISPKSSGQTAEIPYHPLRKDKNKKNKDAKESEEDEESILDLVDVSE